MDLTSADSSAKDLRQRCLSGKTVFAHRGLSAKAPENTMAAFMAAQKCGAKWIETDVDIIADDTAILIHDTALDRTTNAKGSIYNLQNADLTSIDAGSWMGEAFAGQHIPTLSEFVQLLNDYQMNVNLELKSNELGAERCMKQIEVVSQELKKLASDRKIIVSSFNHLLLKEFKAKNPDIEVACLFDDNVLGDDWLSTAQMVGASHIHPSRQGLTEQKVQKMRKYGFGVNVYTVNDLKLANQLFNWGATGIFTDHADSFMHLEQ